jgi:2-hydroxy-3-keto-5-methylthiopentenyl-1-phosphate phosphatase
MQNKKIIFLDFDGTITSEETLSGALMRVIPKDQLMDANKKMKDGELSLVDALHMAFDSLPTDNIPKMIEYYRSVPLREGFPEFLDLADSLEIPIVLLSGGLEPFVSAILEPYKDRFLDMYYVDIDTSGGFMKLCPEHEGDGYLMKKDEVMAAYDADCRIAIGDGITDGTMAMNSDICFARDDLARMLAKAGMKFFMWDDFRDISARLEETFG